MTISAAAPGATRGEEGHTVPFTETTFFFLPLSPCPASPCELPGASCLARPSAPVIRSPRAPSAPGTHHRCWNPGAWRPEAKETKTPHAAPSRIITAFSEADFTPCQGKNCLTTFQFLLKSRRHVRARLGLGTERAFFAALDESQCLHESSY